MMLGSLNQIQDMKIGQNGKGKEFVKTFLCTVSALMVGPTLQSKKGVPMGPLCSLWFGDLEGWAVASMPVGKRWLQWVPLLSWCLSRQRVRSVFHGPDVDEENDGWGCLGSGKEVQVGEQRASNIKNLKINARSFGAEEGVIR